jgi:hypothetical protein
MEEGAVWEGKSRPGSKNGREGIKKDVIIISLGA